MNKIDLKINKNGKIVCLIEKNNKSKYVDYEKVLEYISSVSREKGIKLSIINNTITFSKNNILITIDNYSENKDINLQVIIDALIKEKIRRRNEYLRRKKIKREKLIKTSVLLGTLTIATSVTVTSLISGLINKINVEELNLLEDKSSIILVEDIDTQKNKSNVIQLNYESVENSKYIDEQVNTLEIKDDFKIIEVDYELRTGSQKFQNAKSSYEEIVSYYSNMYGIDPQIMLAIAIQESGAHRINQNTPAIGLMQIEKSVWVGKEITGYNYKSGKYETLYITEEKLNNLDFNIKVACMHFQQCLKNSKNNLEVAIQMYNYGYGNINKVLSEYSNGNINLKNVEDLRGNEWLKYRDVVDKGDSLYLEHVLSYIENPEQIQFFSNNHLYNFTINNFSKNKHHV